MVSLRKAIITGLIIGGIGWAGLFYLFNYTLPTLGPRWLFFFTFLLAVSGTILPFIAFLNIRFKSKPPANGGVIVRQSIWLGIYACVLAWLQLGRVLTAPLGIALALGLGLIEFFLRVREQSRFQPREIEDDQTG